RSLVVMRFRRSRNDVGPNFSSAMCQWRLVLQRALCFLLLGASSTTLAAASPVRLLVVTGGHDYPTSFYTLFEQDGLTWDHAVSNEEAFRKDLRGRYDALVLYDGSAKISPKRLE